jgi:hypothetical protein
MEKNPLPATKAKLGLNQENYGIKIMVIPAVKRTTERIANFSGRLRLRLDQPCSAIQLDRKDNTIIYGVEIE